MKCSACQEFVCEGKYSNKDKCRGTEEGVKCTCRCQVSKAELIGTSAASITTGLAVAGGGVALTIMTGGLFAIFGGTAMVGAGSSMIMNPIQKNIAKEHMTLKSSAKDLALKTSIGAIGPIGFGASTFAKGATKLTAKFYQNRRSGAVDTSGVSCKKLEKAARAAADANASAEGKFKELHEDFSAEIIAKYVDEEKIINFEAQCLQASEEMRANVGKASEKAQSRLSFLIFTMHGEIMAKVKEDASLSLQDKLETKLAYCKQNGLPSSKTTKFIAREIKIAKKKMGDDKVQVSLDDSKVDDLTGDTKVAVFAENSEVQLELASSEPISSETVKQVPVEDDQDEDDDEKAVGRRNGILSEVFRDENQVSVHCPLSTHANLEFFFKIFKLFIFTRIR